MEILNVDNLPSKRSKRCPKCGSRNTRLSRQNWVEIVLHILLIRPYRCRDCFARFWRFL
jgi:uncharacterized protein with PIN domain